MEFIEFESLNYVYVGVLFIISYFLLNYFFLKRKTYVSKKISTYFLISKIIKKKTKKEKIISILIILSIFSLFIALANPQIRLSSSKEGVNVVLVIDSSGSMQANDFKPNRMKAAKNSAKKFISQLEGKDLVGIVSFSDSTRIVSFLTNDKTKVERKLETIKSGGGTAIGDGLAMGVDMVTSIPNKKKLVILLSDGEQNAGQININEAILYAKNNNVVVYTIGVGSKKPIILGYDFFGRPQYAKLDEASLSKIAQNTGGKYYRATDDVKLNKIYDSLPKEIKKEKELQSIKDWFILLSLLMLISSIIVKYWKSIAVW